MAQCKSIILLIIIFLLFISGCLNVVSEDVQNDSHSRSDSKTNGNDFEIIPLQVDRDEFQFVLGWLSNEEILYVKYMNGQYVIHSYNIHTGKELPIYSSEMPIIQGDISPSREFLFLHQARSTDEAQITVLSVSDQDVIYENSIESSEIDFKWNYFDESKLLVVAFSEDWTYYPYIIDITNQKMEPVFLPHPFASWSDESTLLLLDWTKENIQSHAPLLAIQNGKSSPVLDNERFNYVNVWGNQIVLMKQNENNPSKTDISFYNQQFQLLSTVKIPLMKNNSGWNFPNIDATKANEFYIVAPKTNSVSEFEDVEYELVKVNSLSGEKETIIESIENSPILVSPNGRLGLSGFLYENVIDLDKHTIESFIEFKEEGVVQ